MRTWTKAVAAVAIAAGAIVAVPVTAGAGEGETATLTIVKEVVGTPPPGAEFVIEVSCSPLDDGPVPPGTILEPVGAPVPFVEVFTFGPTGGEEDIIFTSAHVCDVQEVQDAGATSVTGEGQVFITDPTLFERTITNTFVAPDTLASTTTESRAVSPQVATRPRFTG